VRGAGPRAFSGVEGISADMGHFGRLPIRAAWFGIVLPSLVLNYFGQGAVLMARPEAAASPFYLAFPGGALYPMNGQRDNVIATGGGGGVMEAVSRGAREVGAPAIGFNITLPREQDPNAYVTPELSFNFHYFAIRKMHFLMRARAIAVFPGGFGTLDELFETLTLIQTHRMEPVPVLLFGKDFWSRIVNWNALADAGTISASDLDLFRYVETAEAGWNIIREAAGIGEG